MPKKPPMFKAKDFEEYFIRILQHEINSFEKNAEFTVPELMPACIWNLLTTDEKGRFGEWCNNKVNSTPSPFSCDDTKTGTPRIYKKI